MTDGQRDSIMGELAALRESVDRHLDDIHERIDKLVETNHAARVDLSVLSSSVGAHHSRADIHCAPPCPDLRRLLWAVLGALGISCGALLGAVWSILQKSMGV